MNYLLKYFFFIIYKMRLQIHSLVFDTETRTFSCSAGSRNILLFRFRRFDYVIQAKRFEKFMHIFDVPIQIALVIGSVGTIRTTKRFFPSVDSNMDLHIFPTFHNGRTEWAHITVLAKSNWSVLERTKEIYISLRNLMLLLKIMFFF